MLELCCQHVYWETQAEQQILFTWNVNFQYVDFHRPAQWSFTNIFCIIHGNFGFGGLGVACWPLVPKFAGSNPAEAKGEKFLSTPSFGGEVKPSVPCRRFAACKRSLNLRGSRDLGKIPTGHLSRPWFHLSLLGSLASLRTEAPGG